MPGLVSRFVNPSLTSPHAPIMSTTPASFDDEFVCSEVLDIDDGNEVWASFPQTHMSDIYSSMPALKGDLFGHSMAELPDKGQSAADHGRRRPHHRSTAVV